MTADAIEACHINSKSYENLKKTIVHHIYRKHYICTLVNRKKRKSFHSESIELSRVKLFISEGLTEYNNTFTFYGRKCKCAGLISSTCNINDIVHILGTAGKRSIKVRWCRARDLFGSQIPVTTEGFELQISCIRSSYLTHWAIRPNRLGGFGVLKSNPPVGHWNL